MKAIILIRTSCIEQGNNDPLSTAESYCLKRKFKVQKVFNIAGLKKQAEKKELQKAMDYIKEQPQKTALIIDSITKLHHCPKQLLGLHKLQDNGKVIIHAIKEKMVIQASVKPLPLRWDFAVVMAEAA